MGGVIAALLILSPAFAQESTPEPVPTEPIPTFTETPTLTPTASETPAPTWTPTASETPPLTPPPPTVEATAEITPEITATVTPTLTLHPTAETTETLTPTTTSTVLPPETTWSLLHEDNFDNGGYYEWMQDGQWRFGISNLTFAAETATGIPVQFVPNVLFNAAVEITFQISVGTVRIHIRHSAAGLYIAEYDPSGVVRLYRDTQVITSVSVEATSIWQPHTLQITALNDVLRVLFDGTEALVYQDIAPLPPGNVAFGASFPGENPASLLLIDHVRAWTTQEEFLAQSALPAALPSADLLSQPLQIQYRTPLSDYVVYSIWRDSSNREDIFIHDLAQGATGQPQLLIANTGSMETMPQISPTADRMVFVSSKDGGQNLYLVNLSNYQGGTIPASDWIPLTCHNTEINIFPSWSPDGTKISYSSDHAGVRRIRIIDTIAPCTTEQNHRLLTSDVPTIGISEFESTWSPDGTQIAYAVTGCNLSKDLYITSSLVGHDDNCTELAQRAFVIQPGNEAFPVWQPGGQFIAYESYPNIFVRHSATGSVATNVTNLGTTGGLAGYPAWSPDGKALLFIFFNTQRKLYRADLSFPTGTTAQVINTSWTTNPGPLSPHIPIAPYGNIHWSAGANENVNFTNIRFYTDHTALKALMFWAIYIETSQDTMYSGNNMPVNTPYDQQNREFAQFSLDPTNLYCQRGENNSPSEQPGTPNWNSNVTLVSHCFDHRYLDAQTYINRFINGERNPSNPHNAANPDELMSTVAASFFTGFARSIGNGIYDLWQDQSTCQALQATLPAAAPRLPLRSENPYDTTGNPNEVYSYNVIIDGYDNTGGAAKAAWRYMAVRWLDAYLACKQYQSGWIQSVYPRIMTQIDRAIADFYNHLPDPTQGAYDRKGPNFYMDRDGDGTIEIPTSTNRDDDPVVDAIYICIGGCDGYGPRGNYLVPNTPLNQSALDGLMQPEYHAPPPDIRNDCATEAAVFQYDDEAARRDHLDQVRNCYPPQRPSILHPVLRHDYNPLNSTNPGGYQWTTVVYQHSSLMIHFPRYVDVCAPPQTHIQNCG